MIYFIKTNQNLVNTQIKYALGRTRTCYLSFRKAALYPDELRALNKNMQNNEPFI